MNQSPFTRKQFLSTTAILSAGLLARPVLSFGAVGSENIRLGIIGTGNRGNGMAALLKSIPGFTLVACCDIQEDRLAETMKLAAPGAKAYTDYRKLLEDKNIEAVLIATPLYLHFPIGMDAIDAGKHVYLEKTMTYSIEEALKLKKKMNENRKLVLQVGHQNRYFSMFRRVKEILKDDWLGKVTHFECQYHRNSNWRFPVAKPSLERQINWRLYREYSGGLMAELSAHQIDIVNWLLDSHPLKVLGMGDINYWKDGRETYDNVRCIFDYPDDIKLSASSILSNAYKGFSIRVLGSKATLEIQRDKAFLYSENTKQEKGVVDGVTGATRTNWSQGEAVPLKFEYQDEQKREPTAYALIDFAACIREGRTPLSNVESGKVSAICVHLANKAMNSGNTEHWQQKFSA